MKLTATCLFVWLSLVACLVQAKQQHIHHSHSHSHHHVTKHSHNYKHTNKAPSSPPPNDGDYVPDTGVTRHYTLHVHNEDISPDGFLKKHTMLINGSIVGPMIWANHGDMLEITVHNRLDCMALTVHWHAQLQRGTPFMDGVPGVTQAPIPINHTFTYRFRATKYGTFYYHSHFMGTQLMAGVKGPLVIYSEEERQGHAKHYDGEMIMFLSDYFHRNETWIMEQYHLPTWIGMDPFPENGLINGKNWFNRTDEYKSIKGQEVFKVERGKKYRIRIINASAWSFFKFSIDNHNMTLYEVDTTLVKPVQMTQLSIPVGQRYSVIIETNQKRNNFWIRAPIDESCYSPTPKCYLNDGSLNPDIRAVLSYDDKKSIVGGILGGLKDAAHRMVPSLVRASNVPTTSPLPVDSNFVACSEVPHPIVNPVLAEDMWHHPGDDNKIVLDITGVKNPVKMMINNLTWGTNPNTDIPTLYAAKNGAKSYSTKRGNVEVLHNGTATVYINSKSLNLATNPSAAGSGSHPFHLHGHDFQVLYSGVGYCDPEHLSNNITLRTKNPPRRDVTMIPKGGCTIIRFKVDNPGVWVFHCHLIPHQSAGLLMEWVEKPKEIQKIKIPSDVTLLNSYLGKAIEGPRGDG